mmetsp:Transcript_46284/g.150364  ORF Transcript_46284/g.150364 Transcript_46284/m.150364 type:complete len:397 (+) Transcript_46284:1004-2194(+)
MCALCSVVPCHDSNPAESRRLARQTTAPRISSARATHARSWSSADRLALPSGESLCRATASCSRRAAASQLTARQRCTACVSRCRRSRARLARWLRRKPADTFHALTALDCARPRGDMLRSAACARCRRSRATVHAACHPRQPAPSLRKHMADSARRAIAYLRPNGRQVLTTLERGPASTARALPSSRRNLADRALATARHRRPAAWIVRVARTLSRNSTRSRQAPTARERTTRDRSSARASARCLLERRHRCIRIAKTHCFMSFHGSTQRLPRAQPLSWMSRAARVCVDSSITRAKRCASSTAATASSGPVSTASAAIRSCGTPPSAWRELAKRESRRLAALRASASAARPVSPSTGRSHWPASSSSRSSSSAPAGRCSPSSARASKPSPSASGT